MSSRALSIPFVTGLRLREPVHVAEGYHQRYAALHPNEPYIVINDAPRVRNLKKRFPRLFRAR